MRRLILISLFLSSIVWAREFSPAIEDSLRSIHPRMRARWLKVRGIEDPYYSKPFIPDSQNVRLVGKWGRGPSAEVTGKDSLVFVSLGSEVAIVKITGTGNPQVLSEIQSQGFTYQSILKDSFLFIATGRGGVEIWNVSNLLNPVFRNRIPVMADIFLSDTFLYTISTDSFKIYSITNIMNPYLIGACRDSGYTVFVSGNYAYLGDRWGLYVLNVSNPQNPYRVSVLSGGAEVGGVWVEGNHCYYTTGSGLKIANVQDPAIPWEEGSLPSIGGSDIYKLSYFLYLPGFDIIDVSDSSNPTQISHLDLPGWEEGVWANNPFGYAFVADHWEGLQIIDIHDPVNPHLDTALLQADIAYDIDIHSSLAIIANYFDGLRIVDISNPSTPIEIGSYDTIGQYPNFLTAVARDSFVFTGDWYFLSIGITDPIHPILVGTTSIFNTPEDMVLRDSLVYVAENYKFEVFNIARPNQPRLVGSCNLPDDAYGMCLKDTFAYIANQYAGLKIINVAQPNNPYVAGTFSLSGWTNGVFVKDTIAYVASLDIGLRIVNVKNPQSPFEISSVPTGQTYDVVVKDSFAYVGCITLKVINVFDPLNPFEVGHYTTPYRVRRTYVDSNYIYCACFSAGMSIFENLLTGIKEEERSQILPTFSVSPNPVFDRVVIRLNIKQGGKYEVCIYDALGKSVVSKTLNLDRGSKEEVINISNLSDGVYIVSIRRDKQHQISKIVKIKSR
jgi:hypothetical protein